jgi:hypothetical protein
MTVVSFEVMKAKAMESKPISTFEEMKAAITTLIDQQAMRVSVKITSIELMAGQVVEEIDVIDSVTEKLTEALKLTGSEDAELTELWKTINATRAKILEDMVLRVAKIAEAAA